MSDTLTDRLEAIRLQVQSITGDSPNRNLVEIWDKLDELLSGITTVNDSSIAVTDAVKGLFNIPDELLPESGELTYTELIRHIATSLYDETQSINSTIGATNEKLDNTAQQLSGVDDSLGVISSNLSSIKSTLNVVKTALQEIAGAYSTGTEAIIAALSGVRADLNEMMICSGCRTAPANTIPSEIGICGPWLRQTGWAIVDNDINIGNAGIKLCSPIFLPFSNPSPVEVFELTTNRRVYRGAYSYETAICLGWNTTGHLAPRWVFAMEYTIPIQGNQWFELAQINWQINSSTFPIDAFTTQRQTEGFEETGLHPGDKVVEYFVGYHYSDPDPTELDFFISAQSSMS